MRSSIPPLSTYIDHRNGITTSPCSNNVSYCQPIQVSKLFATHIWSSVSGFWFLALVSGFVVRAFVVSWGFGFLGFWLRGFAVSVSGFGSRASVYIDVGRRRAQGRAGIKRNDFRHTFSFSSISILASFFDLIANDLEGFAGNVTPSVSAYFRWLRSGSSMSTLVS
ncbi:hypothetical protein C8R47DRAFT_333937 [Mycena vitilis]|nr:hypothetical protein C8R47DRAFT_333937 [Mycena vitilis]